MATHRTPANTFRLATANALSVGRLTFFVPAYRALLEIWQARRRATLLLDASVWLANLKQLQIARNISKTCSMVRGGRARDGEDIASRRESSTACCSSVFEPAAALNKLAAASGS